MKKRGPTLQIRLQFDEHVRLREIARGLGLSNNALVRDAVLFYMAMQEQGIEDIKETPFAKEVKEAKEEIKMAFARGVNRIAALLAKTAISAETTNELLSANAEMKASLGQARHLAAKKISRALSNEEQRATEGIGKYMGS